MNYFAALKIYNQGRGSYCSPKKGTAEHAAVLAIQKGGGGGGGGGAAKPSYADVISMPKPAKAAKAKPTYAEVIAQPKTHLSYADVLMMPKANKPSYADVLSMSRSGAVSNAPMPRPAPLPSPFVIPTDDNDDKGAGGGIVGSAKPPMPSKARIAELKAKGRALIAQRKADAAAAAAAAAPAGVLGKEAGKMINMALKGRLARKRMKEAEKQMLFDILLQDTPYIFKNVPKSDIF